jgi:uncharacterized protein (TIGR02679 family)
VSDERDRLERLLGGVALAALRARLRRRYELDRTQDAFILPQLSPDERCALEGLLGRKPRSAGSMQLSLAELDQALARAGLAMSLREALEQLDGPIREIVRERTELNERWQEVFEACGNAQLSAFYTHSASRGLVKRLAGGDPEDGRVLTAAASRVLENLPQPGVPLSHLAARVLGDAHALDEGRPACTLVLAALRGPGDDERSRECWARWGVLVNELAAPALAMNLPAEGDTPGGRLAKEAAAIGEPVHLSLRHLLRAPPRWNVGGRTVYVCENPSVVAFAADRLGRRCAPVVCTEGMPSAAQQTLLRQLARASAALHYHGDFDWPGITIGNFVVRAFDAVPWRFSAEDYEGGSGRKLEGIVVPARWDTALAPKMAERGHALEEEVVVDKLLEDLAV